MSNWGIQLDKTTEAFIRKFGSLTIEQLNSKPDSNTWSIAQNIEHLIKINESYYPVIQHVRNGNFKIPFIYKAGFLVTFIGKTILKSVQPDRKRKMKTFKIWEPGNSNIPEGILERFEKHQHELKKMIEQSADLIQNGAIIYSPANRNIVYKLETAFDIIVTHEKRHLEQSIELLEWIKRNM